MRTIFTLIILFFFYSELNAKVEIKYKIGEEIITNIDILNEKKYFTVIRDPIDRVYSFFNMALNDKKQTYNYLAKKGLYDFTAYCEESQNTYCKFFSGEIEKNVNDDLLDESESYPVMPLRNTVLFPQQVIPIYIGRDKSLKLINELSSKTKHVVVVAQEDGSIEDPEPSDMYSYGTLAVVLKVFDMPDNSKSAIVQGIDRVKILDYKEKDPYYRAVVQRVSNKTDKDSVKLDALSNNLRQVFSELIQIAPNLSEEHTGMLSNIQKPARLADRAVSLLTVPNPEKQDILEELDVKKRVEKAIKVLTKEIQRIKLGE